MDRIISSREASGPFSSHGVLLRSRAPPRHLPSHSHVRQPQRHPQRLLRAPTLAHAENNNNGTNSNNNGQYPPPPSSSSPTPSPSSSSSSLRSSTGASGKVSAFFDSLSRGFVSIPPKSSSTKLAVTCHITNEEQQHLAAKAAQAPSTSSAIAMIEPGFVLGFGVCNR